MGDFEHWGRHTLNELINVKHGYPFKSEYFANQGEFIVLTPGNFWEVGGFKLQPGKEKFYSATFPADYLLNKGDLIVAMTEQAEGLLGSMAIVPEDNRYLHNQRIGKVTAKTGDIFLDFLYHASKTRVVREQLSNTASGSKVRHTSPERICDVSIPLPPIAEQKKIAAVLSALDAKIDLNNRINAELEALAKTIYDYWFVQFDFPDAHGCPYKSSGGKMVWNDTLKREIPAGWEVRTLGSVISRAGTGLNPRDNFVLGTGNNYYVTIKNVTNGRIVLDDKCDRIDDESMAIIDRRSQLQAGDVLFTSIEPVGVTYLIHEKPTNWNINESVFIIRPDTDVISPEYLLMLLSSSEMKAFTKNSSAGSIHKGIRHAVLKSFGLAYAGRTLVDQFSSSLRPILQKMDNLDKQNRELTCLRDWLLPLLMNGQVRIA